MIITGFIDGVLMTKKLLGGCGGDIGADARLGAVLGALRRLHR